MAYGSDHHIPGCDVHRLHDPNDPYVAASRGSSGGDIDGTSLPADTVLRTYGIFNTASHINFEIHAGGSKDPVVYHCNNSMFTPGTPDVQLRAGNESTGPVVAFGKFHNLSSRVTLGLGDPKEYPVFEDMVKESKVAHSEYTFQTSVTRDERRQTLIWRRTIGKDLYANYVCLNGATGKLMAYYVSTGNKSFKKVGKLCVTSQEGDSFEQLLLVSFLSIREKASRNAWSTGGIIAGNSNAHN